MVSSCCIVVRKWYTVKQSSLFINSSDSLRDKGVHAFSKGISPKVKMIAQLEFALGQQSNT